MTKLVDNPSFRAEISAIGLRAAKSFSMEATAARYEEALCPYAEGGESQSIRQHAPKSVYNGARF